LNRAGGRTGCLGLHFVGNGLFENRGCEAIVRGTMSILRRHFGDNVRATTFTFGPVDRIRLQTERETDDCIRHEHLTYPVVGWPKWGSGARLASLRRRIGNRVRRAAGRPLIRPFVEELSVATPVLDALAADCDAALQVGGDNYSFDYAGPESRMAIDRYYWQRNVPVVLWGASVGPFDSDPARARTIFRHLQRMQLIAVRENRSLDYLRKHGVTDNVASMSDPAFVMEPLEPPAELIGCLLPDDFVGLNFSPMMARYVTKGDARQWEDVCVETVVEVHKATGLDVVLVPHVIEEWRLENDDYTLLQSVAERAATAIRRPVQCVGTQLSAAETKWVISRCRAFIGARTHSTIAAISSCVPTLSLAYSMKSLGLNQDVFGGLNYCLGPGEINPRAITHRLRGLLDNADEVRDKLAKMLPRIRQSAYDSAKLLETAIATPSQR
jgi:polysaccharide pyruvyl transferase WcaK-like protein